MKNIIVTGANGFIGRNMIKNFSHKGIKIWAIDISHKNSSFKNDPNVVLIENTMEKFNDLERLFVRYFVSLKNEKIRVLNLGVQNQTSDQ